MFDTKKWKKDINKSSLELLKIIRQNKTFRGVEQVQEHLELADEHLILVLKLITRKGWGNIFLSKNWQRVKDSYCELKERIEYLIQLSDGELNTEK